MGEIIRLPFPMDEEERGVLRRQLVEQVSHLSDDDLVEVLKWLEAIAEEEEERARSRGPAAVVRFQRRGDEDHLPEPA